jgi:hypothetical protein
LNFKFFRITRDNIHQWQQQLEQLERAFSYPLGSDSFTIDHGSDYLRFFERVGRAHIFACAHQDRLAAVGAGVISHRLGAWYLCDVKVHPDFRGNRLPLKLFRRYFLGCYLKSQRGYALTMEDQGGRTNPITKIMESLPWTPLKRGCRILFFYEDLERTLSAIKIMQATRPGIRFSTLQGIKDLVLKSSGQPIKLLHMEWGKDTDQNIHLREPQQGSLHMWAIQDDSPLIAQLAGENIMPQASGHIFHHRLQSVDWNMLRTSEL